MIWWTYLGWPAMGLLDILVVVIYLVAIVGLGCWAGVAVRQNRATRSGEGLFSRRPNSEMARDWARIRNEYIHRTSGGLAEAGYKSGLLMGNFELLAVVTLVMLAIFFLLFIFGPVLPHCLIFSKSAIPPVARHRGSALNILGHLHPHRLLALYGSHCAQWNLRRNSRNRMCGRHRIAYGCLHHRRRAHGRGRHRITANANSARRHIVITLVGWFRVGGCTASRRMFPKCT